MNKIEKYKNFIIKYKYNILILILYFLAFIQMNNVYYYDDDFINAYPIFYDNIFICKLYWVKLYINLFWNLWSGRLVTHSLTTFGFAFTGLNFFKVLNPIMIFFSSYLMTKIIKLYKKDINVSKTIFISSILMLSSTIIIMRENLYWASGTVPYLWGFNIILYILYFLIDKCLKKETLNNKEFIRLLFLILLQAFVLEQYGTITIGILFVFLVYYYFYDKKQLKKYILLFISSIVFFAISCLAPGNFIKLPVYNSAYSLLQKGISKSITFAGYFLDKDILFVYLLFISLFIFFKWFYNKFKKSNKKEKILYFSLLFLSLFFTANSILNFIPLLNISDDFDTFYMFREYAPNYNIFVLIISIIAFILYIIDFIYLLYKYLGKKFILLFYTFLICIVSIIIPHCVVIYNGTRFLWPTFIFIIILINIILNDKDKKSIYLSLVISFLFVIMYFIPLKNYIFYLTLVVLFLLSIIKYKKIYKYFIVFVFSLLFINFIYTILVYRFNKFIIDYNINILTTSNINKKMLLYEIPYKTEKYGWHIFFADINGWNDYYDYLNKYADRFLSTKTDNMEIIESHVDNYYKGSFQDEEQ